MRFYILPLLLSVSASPAVWAGMDCSDPVHAAMDHCKQQQAPASSKAIPISDGSVDDVPMPFMGQMGEDLMSMEDDPILTKVMINRFEWQKAQEGTNPIVLEADGWIGKDRDKFWFKAGVEHVDGKTEEAEVQALYSHAIYPYWDIQAGVRKDFKPVSREWATVGMKGLAPNFIDVDAALFVSKGGRTAARLKGEYELMLNQKTVLSPEVELNLYGKDDLEAGIGSGLSNAKVGLRLSHEIKREFAPYVGVEWSKQFGRTADLTHDSGEKTSDTRFVAGVRSWF